MEQDRATLFLKSHKQDTKLSKARCLFDIGLVAVGVVLSVRIKNDQVYWSEAP